MTRLHGPTRDQVSTLDTRVCSIRSFAPSCPGRAAQTAASPGSTGYRGCGGRGAEPSVAVGS